MNELQLAYLAPYLPYGLKFSKGKYIYELELLHAQRSAFLNLVDDYTDLSGWNSHNDIGINAKPILRPITDLDKTFEVNGEEYNRRLIIDYFVNSNSIYSCQRIIENRLRTNTLNFLDAQTMFKFHFDVFGLIEKGLAIDINQVS